MTELNVVSATLNRPQPSSNILSGRPARNSYNYHIEIEPWSGNTTDVEIQLVVVRHDNKDTVGADTVEKQLVPNQDSIDVDGELGTDTVNEETRVFLALNFYEPNADSIRLGSFTLLPEGNTSDDGGQSGSGNNVGGNVVNGDDILTPKLVQTGDDVSDTPPIEFRPLVVTRLGGTLPFDRDSAQNQCGTTYSETNGDLDLRLVYHCVCTHTQFKRLNRMRSNPDGIKLVSRAYTGPAQFDELKFDRIPDENDSIVRGEGQNSEPKYEVQLQTKENTGGGE